MTSSAGTAGRVPADRDDRAARGLQLPPVASPASRRWPAAKLSALALDGLVVACSLSVLLRVVVTTAAPGWSDLLSGAGLTLVSTVAGTAVVAVFASGGPGTRSDDASLASGRTAAVALVLATAASGVLAVTGGPAEPGAAALLVLAVVVCAARELAGRRTRAAVQEGSDLQSRTDHLTGLPNRAALLDQLTAGARAGAAQGTPVGTLVLLDVDGFRRVNDRLGDTAGDQVLRTVADAVDAASGAWQPHRTSGDELALLGPAGLAGARACATRVAAALLAATSADGAPLTACAGLAEISAGAPDPLAPLTQATSALRRAQRLGPGSQAEHTAAATEDERRWSVLAARLPLALARGGVVAHLQPVVEVRTGAPVGLEALARWHEDDLGWVSPELLLQVAEATGVMTTVGGVVRRSALDAYREVDGARRGLRLALNASPQELRRPTYAAEVLAEVEAAGVPAGLLTVEVSESEELAPDDPAVRTLELLAARGATVAIDDFGAGYSSLSYLERLPADVVKIDKLLLSNLHGPRNVAVLQALLDVGRGLDLDVVAEGVERREQADRLLELGFTYAQGWLWSKALPPAALKRYLAQAPARAGRGAAPAAKTRAAGGRAGAKVPARAKVPAPRVPVAPVAVAVEAAPAAARTPRRAPRRTTGGPGERP